MEQNALKDIVGRFAIEGTVAEIAPLGAGLINDTFRVITAEEEAPNYVLQRINNAIFPDVEMLMGNIKAVTDHIRAKLVAAGEDDVERKVLRFVPLKDSDKLFFLAEDGTYWRIMVFIPNAITKQAVNPESSYAAGEAFGRFQAMLADIPVQLGETIKDFHNMEFRLQQLRDAVAENKAGRVEEVQYYINEIEKRAEEMCKAERMGREGILPKRICHCDTKVNNMMFDENDQVLCVIDLDTVMPNFVFSDYGDFLRTGANTAEEDEPNLTKVTFSMNIFKAFTQGYLKSAGCFLTPVEIENLPYAAALFPYMQCVRFLADYINGDTYYKIKYPEHNLVRTKNQFALLLSVEANTPDMKAFIAECLKA